SAPPAGPKRPSRAWPDRRNPAGGRDAGRVRSATGQEGDDRGGDAPLGGRAEEAGVAEGEDPAVGGGEPVAPVRRRGAHGHDGPVEPDGPGRAEEAGV